ncbi:MAG: hypothetical protein ACTSQF_07975 [Candidatus Heimdallarchaeaceae archaeon]
MTSERIKLHRVVSWWLVFFSLITILLGYSIARKWVTNSVFLSSLHNIFEWSFIFLLLFHLIYTLIFVRLKTFKLMKHPLRHWIRLVQQASKWVILVFATLVIIAGFNHYEWAAPFIETWFPFRNHTLIFDMGLILSMIIHVMAGAKIFFNRKKVKNWWINLIILVVGAALIAGTLYLEIPQMLAL